MFMKYKESFICANTLPKVGYLEINKTGKMSFPSPFTGKRESRSIIVVGKKGYVVI